MTIDEIIKDLNAIGDYFREETGGSVPACIPEAIELLEKMRKDKKQ